jgi:hypothetical protein
VGGEKEEVVAFSLKGCFCVALPQAEVLERAGFKITHEWGRPALQDAEVERAMRFLWETKGPGWELYIFEFLLLGLPSPEEFKQMVADCEVLSA